MVLYDLWIRHYYKFKSKLRKSRNTFLLPSKPELSCMHLATAACIGIVAYCYGESRKCGILID